MGFEKALDNSRIGFNGLMVIGFLGIVWLMIYGNLSGNLGFQQTSTQFYNETITLDDPGNSPAGTDDKINPTLTEVIVTNATGQVTITTANYTLTGIVFTNATGEYEGEPVNVSYIVTYDGEGKKSTENVITNLTQGVNTFFTFSNTLFTIIAIVLLITILLALLGIVMDIVKVTRGSGGKGSSFNL